MNNCGCAEHNFTDQTMISKIYKGSVDALVGWGVDEVKLDG